MSNDDMPEGWEDAARAGWEENPAARAASKTLGQVAYEAYFQFSRGRSLISNALLPAWDDQAQSIQHAWEHAASAVKVVVIREAR